VRLLITKHNLGQFAAYFIYKKIKEFAPTSSKPFILGLPTGSTPLEMYQELIKLNQQKLLSFKHVITFNLDEYVGLPEDHPQSYHYYMQHNFFKHIDIPGENINILNGNAAYLDYECEIYEERIQSIGGINLLVAGLGADGHIAFNEPCSSLNSVTRVKTLNLSTLSANSRFFADHPEEMPKLALTVGIKTILEAKEVFVLAQGLSKACPVHSAIEGAVSSMSPVSALQLHNKASIICDEAAAYELKLKTVRYFEDLEDEYSLLEQEFATLGYTG